MRWTLSDPDRILAARERASVEPAVAGDDREAAALDQVAPLDDGEPRERHPRLAAVGAADAERERALVLVPLRALEDAGLALDPAPVRLGDVLAGRGEDVEDEQPFRQEQVIRGAQRLEAVGLVVEMEERAERTCHERHLLRYGRLAQVAEAQVDP